MTYVLGVRCDRVSYLCADTAITTPERPPNAPTHTSFGEAHIIDGPRNVTEGMLKLFNLNPVAVALTGDVEAARDFISELAERMQNGEVPLDAIRRTAQSRTPVTPPDKYSLVIAVATGETSRLFAFNANGNQQLVEMNNGLTIQSGSLAQKRKEFTPRWLNWTIKTFWTDPDEMLAIIVSVLQSYGIHDYLVEEGVGGPMCGLLVDGDGVRWQKDILTILYDSQLQVAGRVATVVRDNVLVVWSDITNTTRLFGDVLTGVIDEQWDQRWRRSVLQLSRKADFDFVSLLSNGQRTVTVAEMQGKSKSDFFYVKPPPAPVPGEESFTIKFGLSKGLMQMMRTKPVDRGDGWPPLAVSWAPCENHFGRGDVLPEWM